MITEYKCRRCGQIMQLEQTEADIKREELADYMRGVKGLTAIHDCCEGSYGIADIVGITWKADE